TPWRVAAAIAIVTVAATLTMDAGRQSTAQTLAGAIPLGAAHAGATRAPAPMPYADVPGEPMEIRLSTTLASVEPTE
ncbi:MAG TPA: hypothetical protein PLD37_01965, partial [Usitatibacteraceae bacterium]|nr:hypothetical protein [Usitatibacteraceae bacterium]